MGWGDELMASGRARALRRSDPRPVAIRDRYGAIRRHALWKGVEGIATPEQVQAGLDCQFIADGPGCRPYIDYDRTRAYAAEAGIRGSKDALTRASPRWAWKRYRPAPGEIVLTPEERSRAELAAPPGPFVVTAPNIKKDWSNKGWGFERYQKLVDMLPGVRFVQMADGPMRLSGVAHVETPSFRDACAVLARAAAYVGPEGGLHHAAAALGVPAVVIFGAFLSPEVTGYPEQVSLFTGEGLGCGWKTPCQCCAEAMAKITPERVAHELTEVLRRHGG